MNSLAKIITSNNKNYKITNEHTAANFREKLTFEREADFDYWTVEEKVWSSSMIFSSERVDINLKISHEEN